MAAHKVCTGCSPRMENQFCHCTYHPVTQLVFPRLFCRSKQLVVNLSANTSLDEYKGDARKLARLGNKGGTSTATSFLLKLLAPTIFNETYSKSLSEVANIPTENMTIFWDELKEGFVVGSSITNPITKAIIEALLGIGPSQSDDEYLSRQGNWKTVESGGGIASVEIQKDGSKIGDFKILNLTTNLSGVTNATNADTIDLTATGSSGGSSFLPPANVSSVDAYPFNYTSSMQINSTDWTAKRNDVESLINTTTNNIITGISTRPQTLEEFQAIGVWS